MIGWLVAAASVGIVVAAVIMSFCLACWLLFVDSTPYADRRRKDEEQFFVDQNGKSVRFPSLSEDHSVDLSVVVPAYNEQDRLRPMLDSCLHYLTTVYKSTFEVIIVSDGSTDKTCSVAMEYVEKYGADRVRLLQLTTNRGKGGAVCLGMQSARGRLLLFADADGATKFEDIVKLEAAMDNLIKKSGSDNSDNVCAVVCGSRAHLEQDAVATRSIFRTVLMHGFHTLVWTFGVRTIRDTQCGFKMFTRPAARVLFSNLHVDRWAFDVEMLFIAEKLNMSLAEVSVNWTEIEGSKIVPVWSWLQMGFDVLTIWIKYRTQFWQIRTEKMD
ncbi:dolichyl-phosphate beta-glucosyltransferase [Adelges cooleyi]|uniref:dolichyl-phosphate beta-glucosyltransferase n=1 Tax=Adelges cooleyi TaxID=133065 RepID=UPI0021803D82|nr:dolichyl-phosphate beta-glucosyltransferase [Adelges cooleyi]XP_050426850.1 dolichyl-phosphate beta-glucosyltransferase [Adelges cooleyi]